MNLNSPFSNDDDERKLKEEYIYFQKWHWNMIFCKKTKHLFWKHKNGRTAAEWARSFFSFDSAHLGGL